MGFITGLLGGGSSAGQDAQTGAIRAAGKDYQAYRPEMAQAMLNALSSASTAYQGYNNALETKWGGPQKIPTGYWQQQYDAYQKGQQNPTGGSPMSPARRPNQPAPERKDPLSTAVGAVLDPAGIFTPGIGGLF